MKQHHSDQNAEKVRTNIIDKIATETHRPTVEVERIYDVEYARLRSGAQVLDYVVLFAARRTRETLIRSH